MLSIGETNAQNNYRDSLKQKLIYARQDTSKVDLLTAISWSYLFLYEDSAVNYAREGLELTQKINYKNGEVNCLNLLCFSLSLFGNFTSALDFGLKGLSLCEKLKDTGRLAIANQTLMTCYLEQEDYKEALKYGLRSENLSKSTKGDSSLNPVTLGLIGSAYENLNQSTTSIKTAY